MSQLGFRSGLMVPAYPALDDAQDVEDIITDEAGLRPPHGTAPRVSMVVEDGAFVAQGAPATAPRLTSFLSPRWRDVWHEQSC